MDVKIKMEESSTSVVHTTHDSSNSWSSNTIAMSCETNFPQSQFSTKASTHPVPLATPNTYAAANTIITLMNADTSPPSIFSFPSPTFPSTKRRGRDPGPGKRLRETPEYDELRGKWEELMESDGRGSKNSRMFVFQGLMREWGDLLTKYGYGHEHEYTKLHKYLQRNDASNTNSTTTMTTTTTTTTNMSIDDDSSSSDEIPTPCPSNFPRFGKHKHFVEILNTWEAAAPNVGGSWSQAMHNHLIQNFYGALQPYEYHLPSRKNHLNQYLYEASKRRSKKMGK